MSPRFISAFSLGAPHSQFSPRQTRILPRPPKLYLMRAGVRRNGGSAARTPREAVMGTERQLTVGAKLSVISLSPSLLLCFFFLSHTCLVSRRRARGRVGAQVVCTGSQRRSAARNKMLKVDSDHSGSSRIYCEVPGLCGMTLISTYILYFFHIPESKGDES